MKKKIVAMVTSLVLVAALAVGGTLAWLTDTTETVTNTFTVNDTGVAASLFEPKVDDNGEIITGEGKGEVTTNTYQIIPGATVDKQPTVRIADKSEDCWVYVAVTNNLGTAATIVGVDTTKWDVVETRDNTTLYAYKNVAKANDQLVVFTDVTFASTLTQDGIKALAGKTIVVNGYAHQAAGVNQDIAKDAAIAWAWPTSTT